MTMRSGRQLYMLSFDHRASFEKGLMGIAGETTATERQRISELKALIYQGLTRAVAHGAPREDCAVLVDEEFGSDIARSARREGYTLAMPVERSGQDEFDFEFGEHFAKHVEEFDPEFAKVLVRYNPDGDRGLNGRQSGDSPGCPGGCEQANGSSCSSCWYRRRRTKANVSPATRASMTGRCGPIW